MTDHERHRHRHLRIQLESLGLIAMLVALAALVAGSLFGPMAAVLALIALTTVGLVMPGVPIDLVMRMHRARPLQPGEAAAVQALVAQLADRAGLPRRPACYVLPSRQLNAFATGSPERGAIALSAGMLQELDMHRLSGVIAHEISHLAHRDIALLGLATQLSRGIESLSSLTWLLIIFALPLFLVGALAIHPLTLLLVVLAPHLALVLVQALSRNREYAADHQAAELLGSPRPLADALALLDQRQRGPWWLAGFRSAELVPSWLRSHPPTGERIARLLELERHATTVGPLAHDDEDLIIPERLPPSGQRPRVRPTVVRFPW